MTDEQKTFTVRDRRIAHEETGAAPEKPAAQQASAPPAPPAGEKPAPERPAARQTPTPPPPDRPAGTAGPAMPKSGEPEIDFASFVMSLGHSALIHMGASRHPDEGPMPPNLQAARQTIEILGMLEAKTRGNLSPEEAELLDNLLYNLRMGFVELSRHTAP